MDYKDKYLKYKSKYLKLKQIGGWTLMVEDPEHPDQIVNAIKVNKENAFREFLTNEIIKQNNLKLEEEDIKKFNTYVMEIYDYFSYIIDKINKTKNQFKIYNLEDFQKLDITKLFLTEEICPNDDSYDKNDFASNNINLRDITTVIFSAPGTTIRDFLIKHGIFKKYTDGEPMIPIDLINIIIMCYNNFYWEGNEEHDYVKIVFLKLINMYYAIQDSGNIEKEWSFKVKDTTWNMFTLGTQPDSIILKK